MIPDLIYALYVACIAIFIVIVVHIADDLCWRYRRWRIQRQVFRRISRGIRK